MKIRIKGTKNFVFTAIVVSFLAIMPYGSAFADIVQNLYEVEMPVEGQGREERTLVVREALKEILARISGRSEAAVLADDELLVPNPTLFVQQFRYQKFNAEDVIPPAPEDAKPYTQKLWLLFSEKPVAKFLRTNGFPVWGKTRPATLVWLVVDDQKQRALISNSSQHSSRRYIEQEAHRKGLPFRLPLMDLEDQSKLQVTDVWGNFEDTILAASARYQTEAILVGRIYLSFAKTWNTRWSLYSAGQRFDWEVNNIESLSSAVNEGLVKTGEKLSVRFTQVDTSLESDVVTLHVKNITNLQSYNRVIEYLRSLSVITRVSADQVSADNVVFKLKTRSGRLGVSQAIELGHVLISEMNTPVIPTQNNEDKTEKVKADLIYKLVP